MLARGKDNTMVLAPGMKVKYIGMDPTRTGRLFETVRDKGQGWWVITDDKGRQSNARDANLQPLEE